MHDGSANSLLLYPFLLLLSGCPSDPPQEGSVLIVVVSPISPYSILLLWWPQGIMPGNKSEELQYAGPHGTQGSKPKEATMAGGWTTQ